MFMDYIDPNKVCPKDVYPLSSIDRLVGGAVRHKMLIFLDAYSIYNQIHMHLKDKKKTTFMMDDEIYYYEIMFFDLKNVKGTYQRLMIRFSKVLSNEMMKYT